jgi:hypothetical protein
MREEKKSDKLARLAGEMLARLLDGKEPTREQSKELEDRPS